MHKFFHLLQTHATICKEACAALSENCTKVHFREKELLISPGQQKDLLYFLNDGIVRHYHRLEAGHEWTSQFSVEGEIIFSSEYFTFNQPQEKYVEAYTAVSVQQISKEDCVQIMAQFPEFHQVFHRLSQLRLIQEEGRLRDTYNLSVHNRYQSFLSRYPGLANRIKVKDIASYLGINPDTLSRIRGELSKSK